MLHFKVSIWRCITFLPSGLFSDNSSKWTSYFLKVTEQANSVWTDPFLKHWKPQPTFRGGFPSPTGVGLLSWVQVQENSMALPRRSHCFFAAPPWCWSLVVWKLLCFTDMYHCLIHWDFTLAFFCWDDLLPCMMFGLQGVWWGIWINFLPLSIF